MPIHVFIREELGHIQLDYVGVVMLGIQVKFQDQIPLAHQPSVPMYTTTHAFTQTLVRRGYITNLFFFFFFNS
jgi:hypothetical protein